MGASENGQGMMVSGRKTGTEKYVCGSWLRDMSEKIERDFKLENVFAGSMLRFLASRYLRKTGARF